MSDSETPQNQPDGHDIQRPLHGKAGQRSAAVQRGRSDRRAAAAAGAAGAGEQTPSAATGRFGTAVRNRKAVWGVVAVLCVAAGTVGSVLAARTVARNDSTTTRQDFRQSSAGIASSVKLALQREEELAVSASTFFAANSKASPAEFARWVRWARTLHRFPELEDLGLVTLVRAPELTAFEAQISGHPLKPPVAATTPAPAATKSPTTGATSTAASAGASATAKATAGTPASAATTLPPSLRIVPASEHHYYCLTSAQLVRSHAGATPAGRDYCALSPALLLARDKGATSYAAVSLGHTQALAIQMPVYRGNATPRTAFGRSAASVGWLREVLIPEVMLQQVLHGHPGNAVSLRYRNSNVIFTSGAPQAGAQSSTVSLHNGWSVTSFAAPASSDVLSDGTALAVLIGGILLSVLLGLIVFLLGAPRRSTPAPKARTVPNVDLYDELTGLPNRALTLDRAERMVARAGRQSGMLAGALFIDIDWFKDVNLKLGEAAGDQLLSDRRRAARERRPRRRHRRAPRRRRVRDPGRVRRARGAPGLARPARNRVAAQARRSRRLRPQLLRHRQHRRGVRSLRNPGRPPARRAAGAARRQGLRQGPLHAVQRQHALGHREPRRARGRAQHRAAGKAVLPALPADLRSQQPQGRRPRGADPLEPPEAGRARSPTTSSRSPRTPG